jgi:hypothetical protein
MNKILSFQCLTPSFRFSLSSLSFSHHYHSHSPPRSFLRFSVRASSSSSRFQTLPFHFLLSFFQLFFAGYFHPRNEFLCFQLALYDFSFLLPSKFDFLCFLHVKIRNLISVLLLMLYGYPFGFILHYSSVV